MKPKIIFNQYIHFFHQVFSHSIRFCWFFAINKSNNFISDKILHYQIGFEDKKTKIIDTIGNVCQQKKNWKRILFHWIKIENEKINTLNLIDFFSSFIVCIYSRLLACHIKTNKCDKYNEQRASQSCVCVCVFYTILV